MHEAEVGFAEGGMGCSFRRLVGGCKSVGSSQYGLLSCLQKRQRLRGRYVLLPTLGRG